MQRLAVLCLIAVLVACTSAPGPSSEPRSGRPTADATGSPLPSAQAGNVLDGQIAYVGGADPQIHLLDLASGESLQLTQLRPEHAELTGVGPMRPALSCFFGPSGLRWSPDGERLAFSYGSCDAVIYAVDLEGNLTRIGDGRGAAWSHDGRFLVYGANVPYCAGPCGQPAEPGMLDLQIVDLHADGDPVSMPLGEATSQGAQPVFSHDDAWIAFSGPPTENDGDAATFAATYVARSDGSDARHVADGTWPNGWLPDGRLLVVDEMTSELHAIDLDASTSTLLGKMEGPGGASPDGELLLQTRSDPATGVLRTRIVTLEGEILAEVAGWGGSWASDGRAVAIARSDESTIVVIGRDGSELESYPLRLPTGVSELAWRPSP